MMFKEEKSSKNLDDLDYQMFVIKNFMDVLYDKTLFRSDKRLGADLSPSFIKSLFAFPDAHKDYPMGELGKNARVKSSTITDMVDRLERDGFAVRVRDKSDRRVVKVRLTEKGKKIRSAFTRKRRSEFKSLISKLKDIEIRQLINNMDGASKILEKIK